MRQVQYWKELFLRRRPPVETTHEQDVMTGHACGLDEEAHAACASNRDDVLADDLAALAREEARCHR